MQPLTVATLGGEVRLFDVGPDNATAIVGRDLDGSKTIALVDLANGTFTETKYEGVVPQFVGDGLFNVGHVDRAGTTFAMGWGACAAQISLTIEGELDVLGTPLPHLSRSVYRHGEWTLGAMHYGGAWSDNEMPPLYLYIYDVTATSMKVTSALRIEGARRGLRVKESNDPNIVPVLSVSPPQISLVDLRVPKILLSFPVNPRTYEAAYDDGTKAVYVDYRDKIVKFDVSHVVK